MQDPIIFVSTLSGSFYAVSKSSGKTLWHLKEGQYYYRQAFPYGRKEGNVLFHDTLNTFYLWLYGVRHMVKNQSDSEKGEREREMFYLTTHSTHFIYGYMASDIWLRTILLVTKETRCCHIGYSYRLTARVLLYAPSHRQDSTYHNLCYTSRGALAGMRNNSMGPPHEGLIKRPIRVTSLSHFHMGHQFLTSVLQHTNVL